MARHGRIDRAAAGALPPLLRDFPSDAESRCPANLRATGLSTLPPDRGAFRLQARAGVHRMNPDTGGCACGCGGQSVANPHSFWLSDMETSLRRPDSHQRTKLRLGVTFVEPDLPQRPCIIRWKALIILCKGAVRTSPVHRTFPVAREPLLSARSGPSGVSQRGEPESRLQARSIGQWPSQSQCGNRFFGRHSSSAGSGTLRYGYALGFANLTRGPAPEPLPCCAAGLQMPSEPSTFLVVFTGTIPLDCLKAMMARFVSLH